MKKIGILLMASLSLTGCATFYKVRVGESAKQSYWEDAAIFDLLSKQAPAGDSRSQALKQVSPHIASHALQVNEMKFPISDSFTLREGMSLEETERLIGKAERIECDESKSNCTAFYYKGHIKFHYAQNKLNDFEGPDSVDGDFLPVSISTSNFPSRLGRRIPDEASR